MENRLVANFRYWMTYHGFSHKDVAKALKISQQTLYMRFDHPENFRLMEIRRFADMAGVDPLVLLK